MNSTSTQSEPAWYLYLVQTAAGTLYTGITTDVKRRFQEHCDNGKKTARFLRGKGPLKLLFYTEVGNKSAALKAEIQVKKLSREQKLTIVKQGALPFEITTAPNQQPS